MMAPPFKRHHHGKVERSNDFIRWPRHGGMSMEMGMMTCLSDIMRTNPQSCICGKMVVFKPNQFGLHRVNYR